MDKVIDFLTNNWLTGIAAVGGWIIGFTSDIYKEQWRNKRERKEEHAKLIQKEILSPIYEYLKAFYSPICELKDTPIDVMHETITKNPGHITEDAYAGSRFIMHARVPERPTGMPLQSEYLHEPEGFKRYYADAKKVHYPDLLKRWDVFQKEFTGMQQEAVNYSNELIKLLKNSLKMESYSQTGIPHIPWANYERIAYVIFMRHMGLNGEGIRYDSYNVSGRTSSTQQEVFKCASAPDSEKTLEIINGILKNTESLDKIQIKCKSLAIQADLLLKDFRFEISKNPTPKNCKFI